MTKESETRWAGGSGLGCGGVFGRVGYSVLNVATCWD